MLRVCEKEKMAKVGPRKNRYTVGCGALQASALNPKQKRAARKTADLALASRSTSWKSAVPPGFPGLRRCGRRSRQSRSRGHLGRARKRARPRWILASYHAQWKTQFQPVNLNPLIADFLEEAIGEEGMG